MFRNLFKKIFPSNTNLVKEVPQQSLYFLGNIKDTYLYAPQGTACPEGLIETTATLFAQQPDLSEEEIVERLTSKGFSEDWSRRAKTFMLAAFGDNYLEAVGVKFLEKGRFAIFCGGAKIELRDFADEPCYGGSKVYIDAFKKTYGDERYEKVVQRSAQVSALMKGFEPGREFSDFISHPLYIPLVSLLDSSYIPTEADGVTKA